MNNKIIRIGLLLVFIISLISFNLACDDDDKYNYKDRDSSLAHLSKEEYDKNIDDALDATMEKIKANLPIIIILSIIISSIGIKIIKS